MRNEIAALVSMPLGHCFLFLHENGFELVSPKSTCQCPLGIVFYFYLLIVI